MREILEKVLRDPGEAVKICTPDDDDSVRKNDVMDGIEDPYLRTHISLATGAIFHAQHSTLGPSDDDWGRLAGYLKEAGFNVREGL